MRLECSLKLYTSKSVCRVAALYSLLDWITPIEYGRLVDGCRCFFSFLFWHETSGSLLETEWPFKSVTPRVDSKIGHLSIFSFWVLNLIRIPVMFTFWVALNPIDCRCADSQFRVSASWLSSPNPALLSSSETQVNLGIRSQKSAYLNQLNVSKPLVVSISQKREDPRLYIMV
jgi:hypothetical protein